MQRKAVVVLHHEQRELVLLPGKYLIGRSRSCQLIVSSELVSRRHAELCVTAEGRVTLKDLGSHNGVLVNGHRLSASAVSLKHCDRFKIGAENFTLHITNDALDSATMQVVEVITESAPTEVKHSAVPSMAQTRATHDLDLICSVADRALEMGAVQEAEQLLSIHLTEVLNDMTTTRRTSPAVRDKAFQYGVRLAEVTRQQQWFDFAIDLLLAQGQVATPEQAEALLRLQRHFVHLNTERLKLYCKLMRRKPSTSESIRILSLLEAILARPQCRS
jgi:pSer/pThr/pTyr-binding forkhead associated (FHA) protein